MNRSEGAASGDPPARPSVFELALFFLRLGLTAFGGPAAHIAMMEEEVVRRRGWLTKAEFLDLLAAANLIPGPSSTELAIYIGYRQRGGIGLLLAGVCFILPATVLVTLIAWAYVRFGHLPEVAGILYAVKPVIIAVILQALWGMGRTAVKTRLLAGIAVAAMFLSFLNISPLLLLLSAGALSAAERFLSDRRAVGLKPLLMLITMIGSLALVPALLEPHGTGRIPFGLLPLFLVFLKIGSVLYGSGYVLLAFLKADLVVRSHWLTPAQVLDATAIGQVTPGPVFTTATFIGYLLGGLPGAVVATIGIFLPAFVLVAASAPFVLRMRESPITGAFLDGVIVASLALMAAVMASLGQAALVDPLTGILAGASAVLLMRFKVNSAWLVLGAAVIGIAVSLAH